MEERKDYNQRMQLIRTAPFKKARSDEAGYSSLFDGLNDEDWANDLLNDGVSGQEMCGSAEVFGEEEEIETATQEIVIPVEFQGSQLQSGLNTGRPFPSASAQTLQFADSQRIIPDSQSIGELLPLVGQATTNLQEDESIYWQDEDELLLDQIESQLSASHSQPPTVLSGNTPTILNKAFIQTEMIEERTEITENVQPRDDTMKMASFATARGTSIAPPSEEALQRAHLLLASPTMPEFESSSAENHTETLLARPQIALLPPPLINKSVSLLRQAQANNRQPLGQVNANRHRPTNAFKSPFKTPKLPVRPVAVAPRFDNPPTPSPVSGDRQSQSLFSPVQRENSSQPASQGSPSASLFRRINLEMNGARRNMTSRPKFIPPFKNGIRPSREQLELKAKESRERATQEARSQRSQSEVAQNVRPAIKRAPPKQSSKYTVFDLTPPNPRKTWAQANLSVSLSAHALQAFNIPEEVIYIDAVNGKDIDFSVDSTRKGYREAHADLLTLGAEHITESWTLNHWQLILWKLACIVKASPSNRDEIWRFENVWHQLLYRYEREINRVHRSAIKRIQEHDSSPALPMILVVTQIFWSEPQELQDFFPGDNGAGQRTEPEAVGFELSDGWYRISAKPDPVLAYAAKRGKLAIGTKIAMAGARLEASRDATEVLEAQDSSTLIISANSTCIAPWDAKLGFQKQTYIATLRSLSPEGGPAHLLDLTVIKMYPIGYTRPGEEGWAEGPWNAKEEVAKQAAYEKQRANAYDKAVAKVEKEAEKLGHLEQELIRLAAVTSAQKVSECTNDMEDVLDELLESNSWQAIFNRLSKEQITELKTITIDRCVQKREMSAADITEEVEETCPPRDARSFRVIRVRDSKASDFGMEAQITLWDVSLFEHVEEGGCYRVSNLRPARPSGWSRSTVKEGEIFLSAGRASAFLERTVTK